MVQLRLHTSTAVGHEFDSRSKKFHLPRGAAKKSHKKARVEDAVVDIIKLDHIIFNSHLVKQSL